MLGAKECWKRAKGEDMIICHCVHGRNSQEKKENIVNMIFTKDKTEVNNEEV